MTSKKTNINGVLLFNKPIGISSNNALQKIKYLFNAKKAGHTGTLDPLATGLLPICFGEATKFSSFLLDGNKEYIATIKLGETTTTYDAEGDITSTTVVNVSPTEIINTVNSFLGKQIQTPPIYSALKLNGKALYEYARNGIVVNIKSREVEFYELEILEFLENNQFKIRVLSSKGTYIRSLAHDIGQVLGCGAHLSGLIRTKTNSFNLNEQLTLDHLQSLNSEELLSKLLPTDVLVRIIPTLEISDMQFNKIKFGNAFLLSSPITEVDEVVRLYHNGIFLGIAHVTGCKVKPERLVCL